LTGLRASRTIPQSMRFGLLWVTVTALLLGGCDAESVRHDASAGAAAAGPSSSAVRPASDLQLEAVGFRSSRQLSEHFEKHGAEFGAATPQAYLALAQALRDRPAGGEVLELVRADGVVTRFDRETGAFLAFERDGVIRTFFVPNDGERYFRRQAARPRR
jgi:hypothetical protein